MGRKHRKSRAAEARVLAGEPPEVIKGMTPAVRRETKETVKVLLEKCSTPFPSGADEWTSFVDVYQIVQNLRKKQEAYVIQHDDRETCMADFIKWTQEHGVDTSAVSIAKFDVEGYGLKAEQDIETSKLFLSIPRKLMMTTESARESILGKILEKDRVVQNMQNVFLALHLLCEKSDPESFWAPYIKILPDTYTTPLYYKPEEVELFKGSPAFSEIVNQFRNIIRQYAYFFKSFQSLSEKDQLPIKDMCFDDYRWAVSTVMTRQNKIPNFDGSKMITAMIPLWDMCNHCEGELTTDFSLEKNSCECYAVRSFRVTDQVYMYYGPRSNAELLIHNGFIYGQNQTDKMSVKLGVSKNDPLYSMKAELLARMALLPSRMFSVHAGQEPVDSELLTYLRVFAMDEDELRLRLTAQGSSSRLAKLRDFDELVSLENEKKAWKFLEDRCLLLLNCYPTDIKEDAEALKEEKEGPRRVAVRLRYSEKKILMGAAAFAVKQQQDLANSVTDASSQRALPEPIGDKMTSEDTLPEVEDDEESPGTDGLTPSPMAYMQPTCTDLELEPLKNDTAGGSTDKDINDNAAKSKWDEQNGGVDDELENLEIN